VPGLARQGSITTKEREDKMDIRQHEFTLTGKTPLIMHWDNILWADEMKAWGSDPANKKKSIAGDDRSPAWRWFGAMYHDGAHVTIPSDNLMRSLLGAGAMVPVPGGRSGKTFKAQTQSGLMVTTPFLDFFCGEKRIPIEPFKGVIGVDDFAAHNKLAGEWGFQLFLKRASINGKSKHVRVRPMFPAWTAKGTINVYDDQITEEILQTIFAYAGQYKGLCDWRPGGRTPGSYGMFDAEIK